MKKFLIALCIVAFAITACETSGPEIAPVEPIQTEVVVATATSVPLSTVVPTRLPTIPPPPTVTASPLPPTAIPTVSPALLERPVFLSWPLPSTIGIARISQFPNSAWSWNHLGLNSGQECPPAFGYLLNLDSLPFWRDQAVPEELDKAIADPHQFEMVACYAPHEATDIKAPAGTVVYAAADGRVQEWDELGLFTMVVLKHCLGGEWSADSECLNGKQWYTTYMHINIDPRALQENAEFKQGEQLGTIYDQTINSHLHFEVGLGGRSFDNYINPWGMDKAPWNGCMWLDQSICMNPSDDYKREASFAVGDSLFINHGELQVVEILGVEEVQAVKLYGNRVVAIDNNGGMRFRAGEFSSSQSAEEQEPFGIWPLIANNVLDAQLSNQRIAILDRDRSLFVQADDLDDGWQLQAENVLMFSVSDHRIGYFTADGDLFVKQGDLSNQFQLIASDVQAFQLVDNRVAYVDQMGNLFVNEGELASEFKLMGSVVKAFQVTNVRIGMLDSEGEFLVKEGNLRAEWVPQAQNVTGFQLVDYRILIQVEGGTIRLKEGNLYQPWGDSIISNKWVVTFNGNKPVYLSK